jgi:integrase
MLVPAVEGVRLHDLRHTFATLPEQDGGAANTLPEPTAPATPTEAATNVVKHFGRHTT